MLPLALLLLAPSAAEADLRAAARKAMEYWRSPGTAVAIVHDGKVVLLAGFGTRRVGKDEPVTPDTLFSLGSNGKAFTTAAMAMLAEDGKLKWTDPVTKHLPRFRLADDDTTAKVTLTDLVAHRTGLAAHDLLWYHSPDSAAEMVRKAGHLPLSKPFGKSFQYQSVMFAAAGLAAESASGMAWEDLIRTRLLAPLGMKSTFTSSTAAAKYGEIATPHATGDAGAVPLRPYRWPGPNAAGSLYGTARDLVPWMHFQLTGETRRGKPLIPMKALRETHEGQIELPLLEADRGLFKDTMKRAYAMGWVSYDHRGHQLLAHGGALEGHRCHIVLVREKRLGVAVLANLHNSPLPAALATTLMEMMLGLEPRDWNALHAASLKKSAEFARSAGEERAKKRKKDTEPSLPLDAYAGTYSHPAFGKIEITRERRFLSWKWRHWEATLEHWQDDRFTLDGAPLGETEASFTVKGGKVAAMHVTGQMNVMFSRDAKRSARE